MAEAFPTTSQPQDALLWVDCEFTGLSLVDGHKIIEIGALVTDLTLRELDSYQSFLQYDWQYVKDRMDQNPWWEGRLDDQQRMKAGFKQAKPVDVVDADLTNLVESYFGSVKPPICGNSVSNDKKHIDDQLPSFASKLHYQIIDVSSFKLVAAKYQGIEYGAKVHNHYALDDIHESVDEFRFLLKSLNIADLTGISFRQDPH